VLKFVFWALLAANIVWFAVGQGYLGNVTSDEHEPARLQNQVGTDKLVILSAQEAQETQAAATVAPEPEPAPAPQAPPAPPVPKAAPVALVCTEVSNLREADARKFDTRLEKLDLGARQTRREVASTEYTSYIVFIPPAPSKEAADRKAAELKALDITNFFIMNADSPMKWAISLGVFKSEAAAQSELATLTKQGVRSAKVAGRSGGSRVTYRFRDIDAPTSARIERMAAAYNGQETRACR
jgi:cell division septation protein DedD